jgi:hypothetical protein
MSMMASGSFIGMGDLEQQLQFSKFIDGQYCSVPSGSLCNTLCMPDEEKSKSGYKSEEIKLLEEKIRKLEKDETVSKYYIEKMKCAISGIKSMDINKVFASLILALLDGNENRPG